MKYEKVPKKRDKEKRQRKITNLKKKKLHSTFQNMQTMWKDIWLLLLFTGMLKAEIDYGQCKVSKSKVSQNFINSANM